MTGLTVESAAFQAKAMQEGADRVAIGAAQSGLPAHPGGCMQQSFARPFGECRGVPVKWLASLERRNGVLEGGAEFGTVPGQRSVGLDCRFAAHGDGIGQIAAGVERKSQRGASMPGGRFGGGQKAALKPQRPRAHASQQDGPHAVG